MLLAVAELCCSFISASFNLNLDRSIALASAVERCITAHLIERLIEPLLAIGLEYRASDRLSVSEAAGVVG